MKVRLHALPVHGQDATSVDFVIGRRRLTGELRDWGAESLLEDTLQWRDNLHHFQIHSNLTFAALFCEACVELAID